MDYKQFLEHTFVMFFEIIGLLITIQISAHLKKENRFYAKITILILLLTIIVHFIEFSIRDFDHVALIRFFLTSTKYTLYPLLLISFIPVSSPFRDKLKKKFKILFLLPELISIPFYFTSEWTKLIIYFTEDENFKAHYHGGPLQYWPYVIFGIYLVVFLVANILLMCKYSNKNRFISIYICIGAFIGIIIFLVLDISDDYTPIFTSALLLYYLFLYIHLSSTDQLTGLMNRQTYAQDIESRGDKFKASVNIDMNELKYLNDNFGHDEGDKALKCVSTIILDCAIPKSIQYRIGGDEFVILYFNRNEEEIINNINNMRNKLKNTKYSCAFGYALKEDNENIEDVIQRADKNMYEDKIKLKNELLSKGIVLHIRENLKNVDEN